MKILRRFCKSILLLGCLTHAATALPEGASVTAGSVNINRNGSTQTIQQLTDRAIINWNGFNIDVGELVHFIQPSSLSAVLNRVVGQDPSLILGALQANGQVFLVNPNGVIFGQSAQVDVGSLVVSTLNITDQDFMQGTLRFEQDPSKELAAVINRGTLKIDSNGFLVLTGPMVANEGLILARVGQVALAAGTKSTVSFDPTGMIHLELPTDSQTSSGIVSLSQGDAGDLLSSVVRSPQTQAGEIVVRDGRTFLEVESGTLVNTGIIDAEGFSGSDGGRVLLNSTSNTILAEGSHISAAGQGYDSSGGEVYALSQGSVVTEFGSFIDVSGGETGDGGFVEQSGRSGFVGTRVDLSAPGGEAGTFLIDPERILVQSGIGGGVAPDGIIYHTQATMEALAAGTYLLETEDGVDFEALDGGTAPGALTLQPDVNLTIDLMNDVNPSGPAISFDRPGDQIVLSGSGSFTLTSVTGTEVRDLQVVTDDGNITLNLDGAPLTGSSQFSTSNGFVTADVGGELRLNSDFLMLLGEVSADSIVGTGREFFITGLMSATETIDIRSITTIGSNGEGLLDANSIILEAINIAPGAPLDFIATNLDVTANYIDMNDLGGGESPVLENLTVTSINTDDPYVRIGFGEGIIFEDFNDEIRTDFSEINYDYNTTGNKILRDIDAQNFTLTTDGAIDARPYYVSGDLELTGQSIEVFIGESLGIDGTLKGTSTLGDVDILADYGHTLALDLDSAGDVSVNEELFSFPGSVSGTVNGNNVTVIGSDIDLELGDRVNAVYAEAYDGPVRLAANSPNLSIEGYAPYFSETEGSGIFVNNAGGDIIVDRLSGSEIELIATGDIEAPGSYAIDSFSTVSLTGNTITANIIAESVVASATGDITLTSDQSYPLELTATSTNGDVEVSLTGFEGEGPLRGFPEGEFPQGEFPQGEFPQGEFPEGEGFPKEGGGLLLTNQIQGNNVTLEVIDGSIEHNSGQIVANNVVLIADSIEADLSAQSVDAEALGDITLTGNSPNILVSAESSEGSISVINAGSIRTGSIIGPDVTLNAQAGGNISHASSSIDADIVTLTANNISAVTDTLFLAAQAPGNVTINNLSNALALVDITAGITADLTTPGTAVLNTFQGQNLILDVGQAVTGSLSGNLLDVTGTEINLNVTANQVLATARAGNVVLTGSNANLQVSATALNGDVDVSNTGNIVHGEFSGQDVSITAQGGNISAGSGRISGSTVALSANNVSAQTATSALSVSSPGNVTIDNLAADLNAFNLQTAGNIDLSSSGNINQTTLSGGNINLNAGGNINQGKLTAADQVQLTAGGSLSAEVLAQTVEAQALGDIALSGNNLNLSISAESTQGDVSVTNSGNIVHGEVTGQDVEITAQGGNISTGSGRITGTTVALSANNVSAQTATSSLSVNSPGDVTIDNLAADLDAFILQTAGNIDLRSSGNIKQANLQGGSQVQASAGGALQGSFSGSTVVLQGQSVEADIAAETVGATASLGDVSLSSTGEGKLTVANSTALQGDFSLKHQGDVEFNTIQAENVTIDTTGDITDTANTIIASGITLNGDNILVNTQGQIILINAQGNVVVTNSLVDVDSLSINAQGNISFGTDGDLTINQIAGGEFVELNVGGNIWAQPNAFVNGANLTLVAGGTITPDLSNPLQLGAGSSIFLQARGTPIAAAFQGSLPAGAVTIDSSSGPVFYNGQLLNGTPIPEVPEIPETPQPPPTPPTPPTTPLSEVPVTPSDLPPVDDALNQIGQQTGLVVDGGSVGSAGNDGIIKQSPTQKLVAKLTEAAGGGGGEGLTTETLITLEVNQLGEVELTLSEPSPLDKVIDESEDLSADDLLDLDSEELGEVKVAVYYDPATDRLILAVNLTADDLLDLDVSEFQEVPVKLNYSFQGDPIMFLEALRAEHIIDLEVEDLGLIPVEVHVGGTTGHSANDDPTTIQDDTNQGETE